MPASNSIFLQPSLQDHTCTGLASASARTAHLGEAERDTLHERLQASRGE